MPNSAETVAREIAELVAKIHSREKEWGSHTDFVADCNRCKWLQDALATFATQQVAQAHKLLLVGLPDFSGLIDALLQDIQNCSHDASTKKQELTEQLEAVLVRAITQQVREAERRMWTEAAQTVEHWVNGSGTLRQQFADEFRRHAQDGG